MVKTSKMFTSKSKCLPVSLLLSFEIIRSAFENNLSDGTDVAIADKYLLAKFERGEPAFLFQYSIGFSSILIFG